MRTLFVCVLMIAGKMAVAQSKKELIAEIGSLKAEIEQLKKPKEVDISDKHKKASYGLGMLLAANIKNQGADSLDAEAISAGINDVFLNKETKLKQEEAGMLVQTYMMEVMEKKRPG